MRRCSSLEAAATAKRKAEKEAVAGGKLGGPVKEGSAKRKAKKGSTKKKAKDESLAAGQPTPTKERKAAVEASEEKTAAGAAAESAPAAAGEQAPSPALARPARMDAVDYIVAHKRLPQSEIDFTLTEERTRTPFADTLEFRLLTADPSTTEEDLAAAAAQHEAQQERSIRHQEWVRSEFEAHGEVVVDDDFIARRVEIEEYSKQQWEKAFAGIDLSNFADTTDDEDDDFMLEEPAL